MRLVSFVVALLGGTCLAISLQAREVITCKSPDGKFALRMTHGEEGWDTEIIEAATKKKVIDLESVAVSGDKDRLDWMVRSRQPIDTYGDETTLIWSSDSQRVAYFNENRGRQTTSVYFRNGSKFEEVLLPEFRRCDEIKNEDPKYLKTVSYTVTPNEACCDRSCGVLVSCKLQRTQ